MALPFAAVAMASLQGALGVAQAVGGFLGKKDATKQLNAAIDSARSIANQKLQYATSLDKEWKDTYGVVASQNAEYFSKLNADSLKQQYDMAGDAAIGQVYKNLTNTRNSITEFMNRSNMGNSGQALSALLQADNAALEQNASIALETAFKKLNAEAEIAQQKLGYVQTGENLRNNAVNVTNQAYSDMLNVESMNVNAKANEVSHYSNMMNAGLSNIGNSLGTAASGLFQADAANTAAKATRDAANIGANATIEAAKYKSQPQSQQQSQPQQSQSVTETRGDNFTFTDGSTRYPTWNSSIYTPTRDNALRRNGIGG